MKLDTDRIVSLSAMVVGVSSLFIILYQTQLMREQQHASVMPYLMIAVVSNPNGTLLTLRNAGIGPALIDDVRIRRKGEEFAGDPFDFLSEERPAALPGLGVDKIQPGRLIPAGESIRMLEIEGGEPGQRLLVELLKTFEIAEVPRSWYAAGQDKAVIEITYSSVYGDKWRVRSDRIVTERR
jgi:hypothetical protein